MKKTLFCALFSIAFLCSARAVEPYVPIVESDGHVPTGIAPAFFGPNAEPVPQMSDGTMARGFNAELAGDFYSSRFVAGAKDNTADIWLKLRFPLFCDRVTLNVYAPVVEWYDFDQTVKKARRIEDRQSGKGWKIGAARLSVEVLLLRENEKRPSLVLRGTMRTASENGAFWTARSYDSPGYFFDITAAKGFGDFRVAASAGFLCWQTDNGRQNDAVMFGILGAYSHEWFSLSAQYGGYVGWENFGDFPRSLRIRADLGGRQWPVKPFFSYQHGFHDWPFDQYRAGITLSIRKK